MKPLHVAGLLALWAGPASAQPMQCELFSSEGTPAPVPLHFVLDHANRRAVERNGAVFALSVEERRYRLTRQAGDGGTAVFVIDRDTGQGAWGMVGGSKPGSGWLRCYRAPPRL